MRTRLNKEFLDSLFPDYYIFCNREFITLKNHKSSYVRGYIRFDRPVQLSIIQNAGFKITWLPYIKTHEEALSFFKDDISSDDTIIYKK